MIVLSSYSFAAELSSSPVVDSPRHILPAENSCKRTEQESREALEIHASEDEAAAKTLLHYYYDSVCLVCDLFWWVLIKRVVATMEHMWWQHIRTSTTEADDMQPTQMRMSFTHCDDKEKCILADETQEELSSLSRGAHHGRGGPDVALTDDEYASLRNDRTDTEKISTGMQSPASDEHASSSSQTTNPQTNGKVEDTDAAATQPPAHDRHHIADTCLQQLYNDLHTYAVRISQGFCLLAHEIYHGSMDDLNGSIRGLTSSPPHPKGSGDFRERKEDQHSSKYSSTLPTEKGANAPNGRQCVAPNSGMQIRCGAIEVDSAVMRYADILSHAVHRMYERIISSSASSDRASKLSMFLPPSPQIAAFRPTFGQTINTSSDDAPSLQLCQNPLHAMLSHDVQWSSFAQQCDKRAPKNGLKSDERRFPNLNEKRPNIDPKQHITNLDPFSFEGIRSLVMSWVVGWPRNPALKNLTPTSPKSSSGRPATASVSEKRKKLVFQPHKPSSQPARPTPARSSKVHSTNTATLNKHNSPRRQEEETTTEVAVFSQHMKNMFGRSMLGISCPVSSEKSEGHRRGFGSMAHLLRRDDAQQHHHSESHKNTAQERVNERLQARREDLGAVVPSLFLQQNTEAYARTVAHGAGRVRGGPTQHVRLTPRQKESEDKFAQLFAEAEDVLNRAGQAAHAPMFPTQWSFGKPRHLTAGSVEQYISGGCRDRRQKADPAATSVNADGTINFDADAASVGRVQASGVVSKQWYLAHIRWPANVPNPSFPASARIAAMLPHCRVPFPLGKDMVKKEEEGSRSPKHRSRKVEDALAIRQRALKQAEATGELKRQERHRMGMKVRSAVNVLVAAASAAEQDLRESYPSLFTSALPPSSAADRSHRSSSRDQSISSPSVPPTDSNHSRRLTMKQVNEVVRRLENLTATEGDKLFPSDARKLMERRKVLKHLLHSVRQQGY